MTKRNRQLTARRFFEGAAPLIILPLFCTLVGAWGFTAHRTINQLAIYELPTELREFFYANMEYMVRHSVRPDMRRSDDSTEDAKHFINLEVFGDSAAWRMPQDWNLAVNRYSREKLLKNGYVPYHIITMKQRLTKAFKSRNRDSILFYAADMAHYIGDLNVPLHTTINYDGQLTGQKGLHSLWETMIPEIELERFDLRSDHKARYLKQPEKAIWKALRDAYQLTSIMIAEEKETSKSFTDSTKYRVQVRRGREVRSYTSEFANAYSKRLGTSVNRQLIRSVDMAADFWFTCWVDAGRPSLTGLGRGISGTQKQLLKNECKAFRENKLLDQKYLIAKKEMSTQ